MGEKRYEITEYIIRWSKKYKCLIKIPLEDKRSRIKKASINGKQVIIDPELQITECTKNFMLERKGAKKENGNVTLHPKYGNSIPANEYETAKWLSNEFGWHVTIDKENTRGRNKAYIDLYNGWRWWEEKSPSTVSAIRTRVKTGLQQLAEFEKKRIGGLIINVRNIEIPNDAIKQEVLNAINENCRIDCYVVVRKNKELLVVYKVRHKHK